MERDKELPLEAISNLVALDHRKNYWHYSLLRDARAGASDTQVKNRRCQRHSEDDEEKRDSERHKKSAGGRYRSFY